MKKVNARKKTILVLALISIGGMILIAVIRRSLKNSGDDNSQDKKPNISYTPPVAQPPKSTEPDQFLWLKSGSKGQEVKLLQQKLKKDIDRLNKKGRKINVVGKIDADFGAKTKDALWNVKGIVETSLYNYDKTPDKQEENGSSWWWL